MKAVDVALGLIEREGRWFLQRRDPGNPVLPGVWEFPGGKVEAGESPSAACRRELSEELGLQAFDLQPLEPLSFSYPDREVRLHPFRVTGAGEPFTLLAWGWFRPSEILRMPIPPANRALLARWSAQGVNSPAPTLPGSTGPLNLGDGPGT